jgi:hypothetical protein
VLSFVEYLNGRLAERLLRDRGRLRAVASAILSLHARDRFKKFVCGRWQPSGDCTDALVSLTSWTPRLESLPLVLIGIVSQTKRPKSVVVWLTTEDLARIDKTVRDVFAVWGVEFRECQNFGPHKKWLPLIREGVSNPFVICDDDVFYPANWLKALLDEDRNDAYVGTRCHRMTYAADNQIRSYDHWERRISWTGHASHDLFITGIGGAIIRPERISNSFCDWGRIRAECPQADDIWLKAAHLAAEVPCYKTRFTFPCLEVPESQKSGLLLSNVDKGGNDKQMKILDAYLLR